VIVGDGSRGVHLQPEQCCGTRLEAVSALMAAEVAEGITSSNAAVGRRRFQDIFAISLGYRNTRDALS
jgi:hypothetical protein